MINNYKTYRPILALLISIFISANSFAQIKEVDSEQALQNLFDSLYIEGIREFDKDIKHQNLEKSVKALEEALEIEPLSTNAHYYLAYAYSGLNRRKGAGSAYRDIKLTEKCSEHMDMVIRIDPDFPPKLALSAYSKLTAEWGAQAYYYWIHNDLDSAFMAFNKGMNKGGFSEFMLSVRRLQMDQCPPNSILFTKGDDNFWNFFYLQTIENYRPDIAIVDLTLLNSMWYQKLLRNRGTINFELVNESNKGYNIINWSDTIIEIPIRETGRVFSWNFDARGNNPYFLYYGDEAVLNIVSHNQFLRPVYFALGVPTEDFHNLWSEVRDEILLDQITPMNDSRLSTTSYDSLANTIFAGLKGFNKNSYDERLMLNSIRKSILSRVYLNWLSNVDSDKENAKYLLNRLIDELPLSMYPYLDEEIEGTFKDFKRVIFDDDMSADFKTTSKN